mgnify:CR=1 FL=1
MPQPSAGGKEDAVVEVLRAPTMQPADHARQDAMGTTHGAAGAAHDAARAGINQVGGVLQAAGDVTEHVRREVWPPRREVHCDGGIETEN